MQLFQITVPVQVPDNLVIIEVHEYEMLKKEQDKGYWWTLEDVLNRVKVSRKTFTEKVLYNHKFRNDLEKFVCYPKNRGGKYYFLASKTKEFLENNFHQIMKEM
ncbi:DUF771 domain-containing protein [Bacillus badius]|uniref:DUF771 domain-containing protein n=1 Tax=Bacillus badius TaxID=1455 RepID=UPI001CC059D8|nr:DUF771 domain-containing protein [Bacillus badius]UAT31315.1 DUF771 domain-containing protein [Bacillus badius]